MRNTEKLWRIKARLITPGKPSEQVACMETMISRQRAEGIRDEMIRRYETLRREVSEDCRLDVKVVEVGSAR